MKCIKSVLIVLLVANTIGAIASAQMIRVMDDKFVPLRGTQPAAARLNAPPSTSGDPGRFGVAALAWHSQSVPGGGTLYPLAASNPAIVNDSGSIAFISKVQGVLRNQGVFVADSMGLHPIAIGCGDGGGSGNPGSGVGDPTPIGGTFAGFFGGTAFAPPMNTAGDVLFLCDVDGGSSPRALFLYRAATQDIIKIAAVGDPSPLGGTFEALGPGSMNDSQQILFLAWESGTSDKNIMKWDSGVVTKFAAVGDPAPGGGTFSILGSEWLTFVDGTKIPIGPVPAITNQGDVAFRAHVSGGLAGSGIFFSSGGVHQWYAKEGDSTPIGGNYIGFWGPHLNIKGEVAFFGDIKLGPSSYNSAWIVGTPAIWRKALAFYDPLSGGQVNGQAVSRNPMTPLDNDGNLLIWCNVNLGGGSEQEHLVVSAPDGHLRIVAKEGDPTPLGGTYGSMQAWPCMNRFAQGTLSSYTPGAGGIYNAHFLASGILTWENLGFALAGFSGNPVLKGQGSLAAGSAGALTLSNALPAAPAYLVIGLTPMYLPFKGGTVVPSLDLYLILATDPSGGLALPWTSWPPGMPSYTELFLQYWIVDPAGPKGAAASNALKATTP